MRIMRIFVLVVIAMLCERAEACRCAPPGTPLEELAKSDAVFSGTVTAVEVDATGLVPIKIATVVVAQCWKGGVEGTIRISTPVSSAACGSGFGVEVRYLIYAENVGGQLHTHLCTRTTLLEVAQEDLDALGEPLCTTAIEPGTWSRVKRLYE
jgi:hypothetical protein